jgi:hypothetical protein
MCIIKSSEWHQAIETSKRTPQIPVAVLSDGKLTFDSFHSFAVALAKSQDHQSYLRGFCIWRLHNAVRRWLCVEIPCYTSELKQGRWAKDRAEWLGCKSQKSVQCDAMTWLRRGSYPQAGRN